ncbi:TMEM175 family protein [Symbioplanes lichenis]|uniref:TMEM175 family protein n=1 Tax=Symbioplanes lichenis TaxID=1629072 RepID=UPI002738784A|nr:TMEM175 family protein [Actinoplanes lichenis]
MNEPRLHAERLTFFSDAAAAIALTLLVLPLIELVPEAVENHESPRELITGNLVPFGSFALSFFVIWRVWTVHHRLFDRAEAIDTRVVRINSLWLLCVVLLPFPAELVGAYGDEPLVIAVYIGVLLACSGTLTALAIALRRTNTAASAPGRASLEPLVGNAVCLTLAFVLALTVPGAGYWPLLLLLLDGPTLALVRRKRSKAAAS